MFFKFCLILACSNFLAHSVLATCSEYSSMQRIKVRGKERLFEVRTLYSGNASNECSATALFRQLSRLKGSSVKKELLPDLSCDDSRKMTDTMKDICVSLDLADVPVIQSTEINSYEVTLYPGVKNSCSQTIYRYTDLSGKVVPNEIELRCREYILRD
jgi:hypothetical protein